MTTQKLTKELIETDLKPNLFQPDRDTRYTVWDTFPGLGLVIYPEGPDSAASKHPTDGRKVFFVKFDVDGKTQEIPIGKVGEITVEQAREMAKMIIAWANLGEDVEILHKTASQVISALVDCPYKNKIRFREMVILELTKVKSDASSKTK